MLTKLEILCKTYGLFTLHPHLLSISVLSKKLASGPSVSFSHRRLLRVPLDSKEIKPVNPKGNQPWIFIVRTDAEVEAPILWPPDVKSWLTGKDPDAGKDWRQEEKGSTEDEMVAWHHWLSGHEFEQAPGDGEGQVSLPVYVLQYMGLQRLGHNWATEQQSRPWDGALGH